MWRCPHCGTRWSEKLWPERDSPMCWRKRLLDEEPPPPRVAAPAESVAE